MGGVMNKGGFSWKRLTGVTKIKQKISRATGVPLTKSGRQRKIGGMLYKGKGCLIVIAVVLILGAFSVFAIHQAYSDGETISASVQSIEKGQSICYEIQNYVNALMDNTQTSCLPSGGKEGALSFIVISSEPIFSIESAKKAWLLVVVGAFGKTLNDQPSIKVDELWLSDINQMKERVAFVLRANLAKSL